MNLESVYHISDLILPKGKRIEAINQRSFFFYEELERTYDTYPRNCIIVMLGDMNVCREKQHRSIISRKSQYNMHIIMILYPMIMEHV